ncbi:MAG: exodeoxyribonuclease VII small subunit [Clostridia bacterium]|nr:exodeoxyribonuclease VII small subunit [Clostridia bacterium]
MNKEMSFEAAMTRLEEVVATLEAGSVSLDAALAAYEEGVSLIRLCHDKLNVAEARIMLVREGADGVETTPFTEGEA